MPEYRALIEASPFLALATRGPEGLDCSPRGDGPGFVRVEDEKTLLLPDRRGNNRIDSLNNIVRDPGVALLFLIPGIGETLRVNGRAVISVEPAMLESFAVDGKAPKSVIGSRSRRSISNVPGPSSARNCGIRKSMWCAVRCRAPGRSSRPCRTTRWAARPTTRNCRKGSVRPSNSALLTWDPRPRKGKPLVLERHRDIP